jgi:hypothetical protein
MDFSRDLEKADFPKVEASRSGVRMPRRSKATPMMMDMMMMDPMMMEELGGVPGGMPYSGSTGSSEGTGEQEPKAGFTVLIEGYSPYRNLAELLDPPSVGDDQSRWGFATRLGKLAVLFPQVPFELLGKDIAHFEVKTGLVDLDDKDMPEGIGILKEVERVPKGLTETRPGAAMGMMGMMDGYGGGLKSDFVYTEDVLVDPMTNEEISRTYDIVTQKDIDNNPQKWTDKDLGRKKYNPLNREELYIDHDHWFQIKAKFIWKNAPKVEAPAMDMSGMQPGF